MVLYSIFTNLLEPVQKMTLSLAIDKNMRLFYNRYDGKLVLHDLKSVISQAHQMIPEVSSLKSLIDLRYAKVDMNFDEVKQLSTFLLSNFEKFTMPRAILAENSLNTALSMLMSQQLREQLIFEVFSTWDGACSFLEVDPEKADKLLKSKLTVINP